MLAIVGLMAFTVIIRMTVGGIGMDAFTVWIVYILSASVAFDFNREKFVSRYVRLVVFMSVISLIFFVLVQINSSLAIALTPFHFIGGSDYQGDVIMHGLFLYTVNPWHITKNTSVFGEPGVYQIVLNSAIMCLLFLEDKCEMTQKTRNKYLLVLLLTVATCQSTTGYFGIAIIAVGYIFFSGKMADKKYKWRILGVFSVAVIILLTDYYVNQSESLLVKSLISKVFTSAGTFDLTATSGQYRIGTIELCIKSLAVYPLGVGYDAVQKLLSTRDGLVGAKILTSAAACGIPWLVFVLTWIFYTILASNRHWAYKIVFIVLYFNTALAQSQEFYPALIMFTIIAACDNKAKRRFLNDTVGEIYKIERIRA
jgi:hypothetical protein